MSGRALQILGRFPSHLEAARPGKRLDEVVEALADPLDLLSAEMAGVRNAHRLGNAQELIDVLRLAALHGLGAAEMAVLFRRFARARQLTAELAAAGDGPARDAQAEELCDVWGIAAPHPRLPLFAVPPPSGEPDLGAATRTLVAAARRASGYRALVDAARERTARVCRLHPAGNGTVRALLEGAAIALDLEIGPIVHSADRFWHGAIARDRLRLRRPVRQGEILREEELEPAEELLGREGNPPRREKTGRVERRHAELFSLLRRGFGRALLQVRVRGLAKRSVGPMLVNRDEGRGVGFTEAVLESQELVFTEDGRVLLDGSDVTSFAYAWRGACFGGSDASTERDFVFAGAAPGGARTARFTEAVPPGTLDRDAVFPHAGGDVPTPGIGIGETRFAFFVQEAHFSSREGTDATPVVRRVPPRPAVGFFDGSVFAPGPAQTRQPAAEVELSWLEYEAYAVRVLIPPRFRGLGDPAETLAQVGAALGRFRPLGVDVRVDYIDDRWVLGSGGLRGDDDGDRELIDLLRPGTVLWTAPAAEGD
jgi:hypothetical protein